MPARTNTRPYVEVVIRGQRVTLDNSVLWDFLDRARLLGRDIDVWTTEPWQVVVSGNDAGDAPTPDVYLWQTIPPIVVPWSTEIDGGGATLYMRIANPDRDMTDLHPGVGEPWMVVRPDGTTEVVGGTESNGAFWRSFVKNAVIFATVVGAAVVAAEYVAAAAVVETGASTAVSDVALANAIETGAATAAETASISAPITAVPAYNASTGLFETVKWADIPAGVKAVSDTAVAGTKIVGTVAAVQRAVSGPATTNNAASQAPADPAPQAPDNTLLYLAIAAVILLGTKK